MRKISRSIINATWGVFKTKALDQVIIKNLVSLMSSQLVNYIFPLVTYPYIIHKIGLLLFGEVQFVLTGMVILNQLIDFGYNYRAPRDVAMAKDNVQNLSRLVTTIFMFRLVMFFIISLVISILAIFYFDQTYLLYLGGLLFLFNLAISPGWFFQGIEKMEFIAVVDVGAKMIFTALIFIIVKQPEDYVYILPLWGFGGIISALGGIFIIIVRYRVRFKRISYTFFLKEIRSGYSLFMSNIAVHAISSSGIIILGIMHGPAAVGAFSVAEKIAKIPWNIANIYSQVIYPRVCVESKISIEAVKYFLQGAIKIIVPLIIGIIVLGITFDEEIIRIFTHEEVPHIATIFNILIAATVVIALAIPFNLTLLAYGLNNRIMISMIQVALINLAIAIPLIYFFGAIGTAIAHFITILFLFAGLARGVVLSARKLQFHNTEKEACV